MPFGYNARKENNHLVMNVEKPSKTTAMPEKSGFIICLKPDPS